MNEKLQQSVNEVKKLFQEERWREVILLAWRLIPLLPDNEKAEMHRLRGNAKSRLGRHLNALGDFRRAIEANPQYAEAYNDRGNTRAKMGSFGKAIDDFDQAIKLNPEFAKAYFNRGTAKHNERDYPGAIADFDRAIEINPQFVEAYNNRSNAKNKIGDHTGAIADCGLAIAISPQSAKAFNARGIAKRNLKDYTGAIADFDRAIELNPQFVEAYGNRGNAKSDKGDHDSAIADFNQALKIDPDNKDAIHNRAFTLALQSVEKDFDAKMQAQIDRERELRESRGRIIQAVDYETTLKKYGRKALLRGAGVWLCALVLTALAIAIFGSIACFGIIAYYGELPFYPPKIDFIMVKNNWEGRIKDFSALSLLPFILMGTLALSPLAWVIRMLNRDKHKYWVLREEAAANLNLLRIIETGYRKREDLWLQLFDHYDKRGSANLIADWDRADTDSNSVSVQDILNLVKPGGKSGDS